MLTDVYKRHSKDTADKVPGLVSKADNPKKFGTLLYKLTSKFPKMIKKVKDPQQEYWEKIMKEGIDKKATDEVVDGADHDGVFGAVVARTPRRYRRGEERRRGVPAGVEGRRHRERCCEEDAHFCSRCRAVFTL